VKVNSETCTALFVMLYANQ